MSPFDPKIHHRRSIRLKGYDYTQAGAYFVTVVTQGRECLFGEIVDGEMVLNKYGLIVQSWWNDIASHFPGVELGACVVMPNHIHGIIVINSRGAVPAPYILPIDEQGGGTPPLPKIPTLGQIVGYFKYKSTKEINMLNASGIVTPCWQRNYYERIIRNEREMDAIWAYIEANPSAWAEDAENVQSATRA